MTTTTPRNASGIHCPDELDDTASALMRTELGNAERLVLRHGVDLRFHTDTSRWLVWDGTRWRPDTTGETMRAAKSTVRAIYREAALGTAKEARDALAKHATVSESNRALKAMIALAASEADIPVESAELDADPMLFNVANGSLDLRTGELRPHDRSDLCTKISPVPYDPDATCPRWRQLLGEVFDDPALPDFLQSLFGYTLTGDISEQSVIVMFGDGANGKTTLLNVLLELAGDYGLQAAPDLLLADRRDHHPTAQADLQGRRPVVTSEINQGRAFDEALVKRLAGGDLIKARRMRQDFFTFAPSHTMFLAVNHKPCVVGDDHGIWRRLVPIRFPNQFNGRHRDPQLAAKLRAELPGILAWAVEGATRWAADGQLNPPDSVEQERSRYRAENNPLAGFLADRCHIEADATVSSKDLNNAYLDWHRLYGSGQPETQRSVGLKLRTLGFDKSTSGTVTWHGLRLRP